MTRLTVNLGAGYEIHVGGGLLERCGSICRSVNFGKKAFIVTDSNVAELYAGQVKTSFEVCGYQTNVYIFEAGEERKTIKTVENIYTAMADAEIDRSDLVVALGGGVTGDLAGFAAATWMRGIQVVQIPTTLLAQVDSSVGGKTGVDVPAGKNLVGAFWQPSAVIADTGTLNTLSAADIGCGMSETVKTAAILDVELFHRLENGAGVCESVIAKCVGIKRDVVQRDERESGERRLLNFGHTFGHSVEKLYGFSAMPHGFAVSIGMAAVTRVSEMYGLTQPGTYDRLTALLKRLGLPICADADPVRLLDYVRNDKKRNGDTIGLVVLREIGQAFVHPVNIGDGILDKIAAAATEEVV